MSTTRDRPLRIFVSSRMEELQRERQGIRAALAEMEVGLSPALGCLATPAAGANQMKTDTQFPVQKTDDQWRNTLSPEQYKMLREHGTERHGTTVSDAEGRADRTDLDAWIPAPSFFEFAIRVCICLRVLMKSGLS